MKLKKSLIILLIFIMYVAKHTNFIIHLLIKNTCFHITQLQL